MSSEFLKVAELILRSEKRPLRAREIVHLAQSKELFSGNIAGRTPWQTMKAKLSVDIRRHGSTSLFARSGPGLFCLRELIANSTVEYTAKPVNPPRAKEDVLAFPSKWLERQGLSFQGIQKQGKKLIDRLREARVVEHVDRVVAEDNPDFKQILTYVMVRRDDEILSFRRGNYSRAADFLKGSRCIGFGGHVTRQDFDLFNLKDLGISQNAMRELSEELDLPASELRALQRGVGLHLIGVLNDDSSEVGRKHIAFVFQFTVPTPELWNSPRRGEKAITQLRWVKLAQLGGLHEFEYWSQLCLRFFFPEAIRALPTLRIRKERRLTRRHVICLTGAIGSGKTETAEILSSDFGYSLVNSGKVLARLLQIPPIPRTSRKVFQERARRFIDSQKGPERLARALAYECRRSHSERIVVDGIRQRGTLQLLAKLLQPDFGLIGIHVHTPVDIAFRFYKKKHSRTRLVEFLKIRGAPVETEVEDLIELCNYVLYNWMGRESYKEVVRSLMRRLRGQKGSGRV